MVETVFAARVSRLGDSEPLVVPNSQEAKGRDGPSTPVNPGDQAVVIISKPVRERDRNHLRLVASQPCLVCGRTPSDAHHIKLAEQRAMGRKVSDKFAVPICRLHHRELHLRGNERAWWEDQGIDPLAIAATLWEKTHAGASVEANKPSNVDRPTTLHGRHLTGGPSAQHKNNETKPILPPEAE
jgi:hypothetical protein